MRFICLIACLVVCVTAAPNGLLSAKQNVTRAISSNLQKKLEEYRIIMKQGYPHKDIPVLDPFKLEDAEFDFEFPLLSFSLKAGGITMTGLSDFEVESVELTTSPLGLKYDFTLPMTLVTSDTYSFKGMVFNALPIYGDGETYFEIGKLRFIGFSPLVEGPQGVFFEDLKFQLKIGSILSKTTGMLGGGAIDNVVNAMLADLGPAFFELYSDIFSEIAKDVGMDIINGLFEGVYLEDLVHVLN